MQVYVEFKTWAEGPIETPWPFVVLDEVPEYRKRADNGVRVSESQVKSVFMTFDQPTIKKFLEENISGLLLAAVVPCQSLDDIQSSLDGVFGKCEIVGKMAVDSSNQHAVNRVMQGSNTQG